MGLPHHPNKILGFLPSQVPRYFRSSVPPRTRIARIQAGYLCWLWFKRRLLPLRG